MWCTDPFTPRATGGKRQRFCSEPCRRDFDSGCRAWVKQFVSSELLPVAALKHVLCQRARSFSGIPASNPTGDTGRVIAPIWGLPCACPLSTVARTKDSAYG